MLHPCPLPFRAHKAGQTTRYVTFNLLTQFLPSLHQHRHTMLIWASIEQPHKQDVDATRFMQGPAKQLHGAHLGIAGLILMVPLSKASPPGNSA